MKLAASMIETARVTRMLRLVNHLHRMPRDPTIRKNELLDGVSAMVSADDGACAVLHDNSGPEPAVLSVAHFRRSGRRVGSSDMLIDRIATAVRRMQGRRRDPAPREVGTSEITTIVRLHRNGTYGGLALVRRNRPSGFNDRDRALVEAFHNEMSWVYELDLPLASPEVVRLPPRARETLQFLLAGMGEKEIAIRLKLSYNTIHHYVKQLYRHFAVSSRSELLARWVREDQPVRRV